MESSVSGLPTSSETDEEEGGVHATPASAPSAPSPPSSHLSFSVENILAPGRFGHHSLHHNHRLAQTFIDDGKTPFTIKSIFNFSSIIFMTKIKFVRNCPRISSYLKK